MLTTIVPGPVLVPIPEVLLRGLRRGTIPGTILPVETPAQRIQFFWLGRPRIKLEGRPVEMETRKASALLAYLSLSRQGQPRDVLATLFWPDYDTERALGNLRRVLWAVNKSLPATTGQEWLEMVRNTVGPIDRSQVWVDVDAFHGLLAKAREHAHKAGESCPECLSLLGQAADLYSGDFMEGLTLRDSAEFDDWQYLQRDTLRQELAGALEHLALGYAAIGDLEHAIPYARQWVTLDRLDENAQQALIRFYARSGQRSAALRQYEDYSRLVRDELGEDPDELTLALYEEIRGKRHGAPTAPAASPTPASSSVPCSDSTPELSVAADQGSSSIPLHLPNPSTAFVGRQDELANIVKLLRDPAVRLLTLLGPGGSGKTRLAIQAARVAHQGTNGNFSQGIYFVSLAPLNSPDHLVGVIATALNFTFTEGRQPKELLLQYLSMKRMLLVLDNFEHLLPAVDLLADIMERAPQVTLLVTSRERLNLAGESAFEVQGMLYPKDDSFENPEDYSSICMFLQIARRSSFNFRLAEEEKPVLARITRLVSGMPLALELAATWVRSLPLAEIAVEIEENLDFLATNRRDIPERHQSLRAVFEYSWNLLDSEEKRVFPRLAAFHGGFTRQAALAVAGASLRMLTSLVDQSLVKVSSPGRYEIHELLRQYAEETLEESPAEKEAVQDAHSRFYLQYLSERAEPISDSRVKIALADIDQDLENIRIAWDWAANKRLVDDLGRAMLPARDFLTIKTYLQEGREIFAEAIEAFEALFSDPAQRTPDRMMSYQTMLAFHAIFCYSLYDAEAGSSGVERVMTVAREVGTPTALALANVLKISFSHFRDLPAAEPVMDESVQVLEKDGYIPYLLWALEIKANIKSSLGKIEEARQAFLENLELARRQGNIIFQGEVMISLGNLAEWTGNLEEARYYYENALDIVREVGFRWAVSLCLDFLGYVNRLMGDFDRAEICHQQSLASSQENGDPLGIAGSYDNLGLVAYDRGDTSQARELINRGLEIRRWVNEPWNIAVSLENLASIDMVEGRLDDAAEKLAESLPIRRELQQGYGLGRTMVRLGRLSVLRGNLGQAEIFYREALEVTYRSKAWPLTLASLVGLSSLEPVPGSPENVLACLLFCQAHSSTYLQDRSAARHAAMTLEQRIPQDAVDRARRRAANMTLEDLVQEIQGLGRADTL